MAVVSLVAVLAVVVAVLGNLDDKIFSLAWPFPLLFVIALVFLWVLVEFLRGSLDLSGSIATFVMGVIVLWTTKLEGFFLLFLCVVFSTVAKKFCASSAGGASDMGSASSADCASDFGDFGRSSAKLGMSQVLARALMIMLSALMWYVLGTLPSLVMFGASIAEFFADSLASSIGSLSKSSPFSIRNFEPVSKGFSGGVTLLGILASFVASIVVGFSWVLLFYNNIGLQEISKCIALCSVIALTGFMGSIIDSYLGACVQAHYINPKTGQLTEKDREAGLDNELSYGLRWVDNDMVNLLSNIFSAVFSFGMAFFLV